MSSLLQKIRSLIQTFGLKRIILTLVLIIARNTVWYQVLYRIRNMPPGPTPLPIIGNFNLLSPPNTLPGLHKDLWDLSKKYGPVFSLWFGSNYGIVLNSKEAFYEALKTKQDQFANRPVLPSYEALTHGHGVAMNNGARWRLIRTILQQTVTNKQKGLESELLFLDECQDNLAWLNEQCAIGKGSQFNLRMMLRREALNGMMQKLYGFRFGNQQSPEYDKVQDFIRVIFEHIALGSPSDFMPLAKYFPNEEEKNYFKTVLVMENYIDAIIDEQKKTLANADPNSYNFVHAMLASQKAALAKGEETMTDLDIRVCCWDCMAGGIDTASTSLEWILLILANRKDLQKKAQAVLDEFVGPDRLPRLSDEPNLHYITAIINEAFRWKHFAPQGLPHEAAEDTTLLGYNVAKGTQVFLNFHSLHMNPGYWVNPEEFRPERFLEEEKDLLDTCLHPEKYFTKPESYKFVPYGQGRRRCVGYGVGRVALWVKVAMYLHCFEWDSADGLPFDLDTEILGVTMVPVEQRIKATPRSAARLCKSLQDKPGIVQR